MVCPADGAIRRAGDDGIGVARGEGPAEIDAIVIRGDGVRNADIAAPVAEPAAKLEREAIVNDGVPCVIAGRERDAIGEAVPGNFVVARGEFLAGEEPAGNGAIGAVDVERDEAGAGEVEVERGGGGGGQGEDQ